MQNATADARGAVAQPVQAELTAPAVETRVLTVHLEPVLPPRVSSQLVRLSMDAAVSEAATAKAAARTTVKNPQFEADAALLTTLAAASLALRPVREGVTYLMTPLPPYERRFSHPESRRTHERKVTQSKDELMCGSLATPGYYFAGKASRVSLWPAELAPVAVPDNTAWLQHEHPVDGTPETTPRPKVQASAHVKPRETRLSNERPLAMRSGACESVRRTTRPRASFKAAVLSKPK
jgi:hypothetical protein